MENCSVKWDFLRDIAGGTPVEINSFRFLRSALPEMFSSHSQTRPQWPFPVSGDIPSYITLNRQFIMAIVISSPSLGRAKPTSFPEVKLEKCRSDQKQIIFFSDERPRMKSNCCGMISEMLRRFWDSGSNKTWCFFRFHVFAGSKKWWEKQCLFFPIEPMVIDE